VNDTATTNGKGDFAQTTLTALRLGLIFLILYWCFQILAPFIPLVLWGAIIAIAIYPLHLNLAERLGNRNKLSATLMTLLGLVILTAPVVILTESLMQSSTELAAGIADGSLQVPPPPENVESLPLVGDKLDASWTLASENLDEALKRFNPQLEAIRGTLIKMAGGAGGAFLQMFASIIIMGFFLATPGKILAGVRSVVSWLAGGNGPLLLAQSETTIRSVARGILGVAIIESILAAIAMVIAGVPAAGFWTFLILVLSIVQVPPLLVMIPMAIYVVSTSEPLSATIFVVLSVLVVLIDTFLKPVLLGRTADAPMLIILMGAIGGMMLAGIVGLFVGAAVLVLAWELLEFAVEEKGVAAETDQDPQPAAPDPTA